MVYANENTADIYKAFSDGWIDEREMIAFLMDETSPVMLEHQRGNAPRASLGYEGGAAKALTQSVTQRAPAYPAQAQPSRSLPNGYEAYRGGPPAPPSSSGERTKFRRSVAHGRFPGHRL